MLLESNKEVANFLFISIAIPHEGLPVVIFAGPRKKNN
jgi:hypothetical protein